MLQKFFKVISLGLVILFSMNNVTFASAGLKKDVRICQLTVYIEGVFDAKVSLKPFKGLKTVSAIAEVPHVLNGKLAVIKIPGQHLPGEFLLRIDYRKTEKDAPYPAERVIFINQQNVEIFVNPPYINNNQKTKFNADEKENTVYVRFMQENATKRKPLDLLRQFLLNYDRTNSDFYIQGIKEFQQRRIEYNNWLTEQTKLYQQLYVSHLFQFQYIPEVIWGKDENDRLNQLLKNYFEGINFNDPLIINSREFSKFMDTYMGLYGMQIKNIEQRDAFFTQAGEIACEKAAQGNPLVYGWMVDYFYIGYESYGINKGITMLEKHIQNPNCLTSKKQQIMQRLEGMKRLVSGAKAPDFAMPDNKGKEFTLYQWKPKTAQKLILFWTTSCINCIELVDQLQKWYNQPENKLKLEIVAVNLDEAPVGSEKWAKAIIPLSAWKNLQAKKGVNSLVAKKYAILSTPAMFLVDSQNNNIIATPGSLEELIKVLK